MDQKLFFSPKSLIKNYGSYIWTKKRFFDNMFLNQRFFWINIFWTKKCLDLTFFWNENFWTKFLETYIKFTYPPVMFLLNSNKNAMSKQKNDRFWPKPDYRMFTTSRLLQSFLKAALTINPRHLKLFQFNSKITSKTTGRITSSQVNLVLLSLALLYLSLVFK